MAAANYMDASYAVSGRRLLLMLAAAVATLAIALAVTVGLLRLVAPDWLRSHGTDLRAIFLVEAYLALGAGLLAGFGGPDGVARRLRFRFTSLTDVALAIGLWVVTLFVGGLVTAALTP